MILELYISENTARKIQGLSVLSGKTTDQITKLLENNLETILNNEIIASIGLTPPTSVKTAWVEEEPEEKKPDDDDDGGVDSYAKAEKTELEADEDPETSIDSLLGPKDDDELSVMKMEDLDQEIGYQDPFMKSVQEEASRGRVSEVNTFDFDEDEPSGVTATAPKKMPMDYGIDKISENDAGATDFFAKIMMGERPIRPTKLGNYSR